MGGGVGVWVWACTRACTPNPNPLCDLWTVAHQAPPSMGFSRQEYWSGLPCPPPGDLADPETGATSPSLAGRSFIIEPPWKALKNM